MYSAWIKVLVVAVADNFLASGAVQVVVGEGRRDRPEVGPEKDLLHAWKPELAANNLGLKCKN